MHEYAYKERAHFRHERETPWPRRARAGANAGHVSVAVRKHGDRGGSALHHPQVRPTSNEQQGVVLARELDPDVAERVI
jgi:hypothetical protein